MTEMTFPFVDAIYRTESDPRYAGNPFIEALPALPDDLTLMRALAHLPEFDPSERQLSAPQRIQRLDTLQTIVVPIPRLVRLARAILKMMHTGYGKRKPFSRSDNKILQDLYALQQSGNFTSAGQTTRAAQHSMALIGASGCGKTFALRQIAGLFPPAIYHPTSGKWQLPCIFIEMSYDGESVHTLASELFQELDRLIPDFGYTNLFMEHRGLNAMQRLAKALHIAHEHGAGMIFVDEAQNQKSIGNDPSKRVRKNASSNAPKNETPLTKLLITASNESKIPLLLAGTLEMQPLLGPRFSRSRRMAGRGSDVWLPLKRSGNLRKPMEYEQVLKALWRYQWIRIPVELTEEWSDIFFMHTQAIPDIMVKLFESSQEAAIANRTETLTKELVAEVFAREFATVAFGITALRDGDRLLLDAVSDLYQPDRVLELKDTRTQFPLPRSSQTRAKDVPGSVRAARVVAVLPEKAPKATQPSPTPISISIEVAQDSDLRKTLTGLAGAPVAKVVDLAKACPI